MIVTKIKVEPSLWYWRLVFYWLNFGLMTLICFVNIKDRKNPEKVSILSSYMSVLMGLLGIKMAILYYFIGVFWFMGIYTCPTLILFNKIRRLKRKFLPTPSRVYIFIGTMIFIASIILDDVFPYAIIYTSYGLTIDLLANPITQKAPYYS